MQIIIFLSVVLLFSIVTTPAHAFLGFDTSWNFVHDLKRVSQNVVETFTIDPVKKQELVLKNMAGWQSEKEKLVAENKPVPKQYDEIIESKKETVKKINTNSTSALTNIMDTILIAQELGKIQNYVDRFHELKENTNDPLRSDKTRQLEKEVNQLNLVKKHCTPVSVNVLLSVKEPYDSIIQYCPVLKSVPKSMVMSTLNGE